MTKVVNEQVETTAAVGAAVVSQQTTNLVALVQSYSLQPSLIAGLTDGRGGDGQVEPVLENLSHAVPGISASFVASLGGTSLDTYPLEPSVIGTNFAYRDWFKGLVASGHPYVSDAIETKAAGHPLAVIVADYIRGSNGRPIAILGVNYSLKAIQSFSDTVGRAQGITLSVTDQVGTSLTALNGSALLSLARDPRVIGARADKTGVLEYTPVLPDGRHGVKELSAYTPVPGIGWTVTASKPASVAFAGLARLRDAVLAISAVLVLLVLFGSAAVARSGGRRRQSEGLVQRGDRHLAKVMESTDEASVSTDAHGAVTAWNHRAETLFGWPAAEALGRPFIDLLIPTARQDDFRRGLARRIEAADLDFEAGREELTFLHRDGHEISVEAGVLVHEGGDGFSAFVHDIGERVRIAAELEAARDEALAASRLKSEFLANMSHEIRTPMNGVVGMSELMLQTDLDDDQREYAETVSTSAEALLTVIDDILDFSKIEAGKLDVETVAFDLREVVEDSASLVVLRAERTGLELTCMVDERLPSGLYGDPGRLRQVLLNLLGNALKFTSAGEVGVTAWLADDEVAGGVMVRLTVSDTGIGMTEASLQHLFEAFTQADSSTTRRYGGTGLGLAISSQLVELMGGKLTVVSEVGVGSTFSALIPFQLGPATSYPSVTDLGGVRVLVVDGNSTNQRVLQHMVAGWGCLSRTTDNLSDAMLILHLAAETGTPFDVLLLDFNVPDIDGHGLTFLVQSNPALARLPIILLISSAQSGDAERAKQVGISSYLTKPVRLAQLRAALVTVLRPNGAIAEVSPLLQDGTAKQDQSPANVGWVPKPPAEEGPAVLLVEDNAVNQKVALLMLKKLGYTIDVADNGVDALICLANKHYSAVLMDCHMPVMDGYQATGELRRREGPDLHTPVIALTASAMSADQERCLHAGMDDYLTKPVKIENLAAVVERWVSLELPA